MPGPAGYYAQLGFGFETTPGTAVTPTRFIEFNSESLKLDRSIVKSKAIQAGRKTVNRYAWGLRTVSGDITYEIMPSGMGIMPQYWIGGSPVQSTPTGGTNSRLYTTSAGSLDGKARTIQVGRPNNTGTVDPFTYSGCKVTDWELSCESGSDGLLTMKETIDGYDQTTATALATATYPTTNPLFVWSDANISITVGGVAYPIKKLTVGGSNGLMTDRTKLGLRTNLEPLEGADFRSYPVSFDAESYAGLTASAQTLLADGVESQLVAKFTGPYIEGTIPYMFQITLARCIFTGDNPTVDGANVIDQTISGEALYNNAGADVVIAIQNADTTA